VFPIDRIPQGGNAHHLNRDAAHNHDLDDIYRPRKQVKQHGSADGGKGKTCNAGQSGGGEYGCEISEIWTIEISDNNLCKQE